MQRYLSVAKRAKQPHLQWIEGVGGNSKKKRKTITKSRTENQKRPCAQVLPCNALGSVNLGLAGRGHIYSGNALHMLQSLMIVCDSRDGSWA